MKRVYRRTFNRLVMLCKCGKKTKATKTDAKDAKKE